MDTFEIRNLPLDDLFCPVRDVPIFVEELSSSIDDSGLHNPIIVVRGPLEDLVIYYEERGFNQSFLPDTPIVNSVWGGTNRIAAAKALDYTHIDCVLIPDFFYAMKVQDLQRNAYTEAKRASDGTTSAVGCP